MSATLNGKHTIIRRSGLAAFSLALLTCTSISGAFAQTLPSSVDPARLQERFEPKAPQAPASSIQAPVTQEQRLSKQRQEALAKQKFTLKSVDIEGNTVYSDEALKFAYADGIGKQISMLEAQAIAKRITDMYRSNGYILSQAVIPDQKAAGGTLKVRVVEGYISNVILQGDIKESGDHKLIESFAANIKGKRPIRIADMERYMLLMDDLPGATAKGVVRPSATPGSADLVVTFTHKTYEASYNINNRGSKIVGPLQHSMTFAANSIFGVYDRTLLRAITTSPTTELRFFDLQHEQQIADEGTRMTLTGSYSHSRPSASATPLDFRSDSTFFQAKFLHPFERSRQSNLVGRLLFDARNTETDVFVDVPLSTDRIRSVRLGGSYDFADSLAGVNLFDAEISQGFDVFGATDSGTDRSRSDGESDYTKINFDATRTQSLPNNFSLYGSASGQYSFSRLLVAEQFSVGGQTFGQAYDPAELSGDHGIAAKVELRYGRAPGLDYMQSYQAYGFYDIGRTWLRDVGAGSNDKNSLASTGIGLRTNFSQALSGDFQVAVPLTKTPNSQPNRPHDPRFFFTMTGRF